MSQTKKRILVLSAAFILFMGFVLFVMSKSPMLISMVELSSPGTVPTFVLTSNLGARDQETVLNSLFWLTERKDASAVEDVLPLLNSEDDYIWLNAAQYLGVCGREEAVPYLIKALRHTAWRSVNERVVYLQKITGESFGKDFEKWRDWWMKNNRDSKIEWRANLGPFPRLPRE